MPESPKKAPRLLKMLAKKIGLRTVEIGENLAFWVNGKPIFARGANWIPCETDPSRETYGRYLDLLTSARDANMNMLRLWGGGKFEKGAFYEICDSLGLLIWHDMMFACAMHAFGGKLTAIVRSRYNEAGKIYLRATSPGLQDATLVIRTRF